VDTVVREIAEVRDYVGWLVIIAGLVAWLVLTRTVPQATFGLLGAILGVVVGLPAMTILLEPHEPWVAAALAVSVLGAIVGVSVGSLVDRRRRKANRYPSLAARVVACATVGGVVGLPLIGFGVATFRDPQPDLDLASYLAGLVGGALGWCIGAAIGRATARRDPVVRGEAAALIVLIFVAVTMGIGQALAIRSASIGGPSIDEVRAGNPKLIVLEAAAWVGTVAVAGTFAWLAFRRPRGNVEA
jgi:membrane protein YqaA with SNARE-associated domain